jgi:DNA-binding response OmpR family regulator
MITGAVFSTSRSQPIQVVRILFVEDCKSDVALMEHTLEHAGVSCFYEITDVPRLVDAFSRIDRETFDLVILDLNLIDIDGIASVAALRAQMPRIPIVVYSGMDDARTKEKALMCGATQYIVKGRENGQGLKSIIERMVTPA